MYVYWNIPSEITDLMSVFLSVVLTPSIFASSKHSVVHAN